jgi:hypothetical protein
LPPTGVEFKKAWIYKSTPSYVFFIACIFIRDTPILSSERMLPKDYDHKGSVRKNLVVSLKGLDAKTN